MFKNSYPIFEKRRLLKIEMLKELRDYPREFTQILYQNVSNGIVSGAGITVQNDHLIISPGILCFGGILYSCAEPLRIPYQATEVLVYLKVRFMEETKSQESQEYLTQIYIDDKAPNELTEMELARFKLQAGARLRDRYTDYFDHNTEFDTVNRIHVPFAAPEKPTIWPDILAAFAKKMMTYPIKNTWDYSFCMSCLQLWQGMPYEMIHQYLNVRLQEQRTSYTNQEIYKALERMLHEAAGNQSTAPGEYSGQKRMLLL